MKSPKAHKETAEEKRERERAEADRLREIQSGTSDRTRQFRRMSSPRMPMAGGSVRQRTPLA